MTAEVHSRFPKYVITKSNLHAGWWGNGVMPMLIHLDRLDNHRAMLDDLNGIDKGASWKECAEFVLDVADRHQFSENGNYVLGLPLPEETHRSSFASGVFIHDERIRGLTIDYMRRLADTLTRTSENPRAIMMESLFGHRVELFPVVEEPIEVDGTKERMTGAPIGVAIAITSPKFWAEAVSADGELLKPLPMLVLLRDDPRPCCVAIDTNIGWLYWSVKQMLGEKNWCAFVERCAPEPNENEGDQQEAT